MGNYSCDFCYATTTHQFTIQETDYLTNNINDNAPVLLKPNPFEKYKIHNSINSNIYGELFLCTEKDKDSGNIKHFTLYKVKVNKEISDDYILNYQFEKRLSTLYLLYPYTLKLIEIYEDD